MKPTSSKLVSIVEGTPHIPVREGHLDADKLNINYDHEQYSKPTHPLDAQQDAAMAGKVPPGAAAPTPQSSYDKLLELEEGNPEVLTFLTVISQIYNGGVQQLADNEKGDEVHATIDFLDGIEGRTVRTFSKLLRNSVASIEAYAAASQGRDEWGNQNEVDPDRYFGAGSVGDTLEDYLYDEVTGEALCAEVLAAVQGATPAAV